jgi:hypothetical protein
MSGPPEILLARMWCVALVSIVGDGIGGDGEFVEGEEVEGAAAKALVDLLEDLLLLGTGEGGG